MRQPISFIYRNLVFGEDPDDVWAVYRLSTRSYSGLAAHGKLELLTTIASFAYGIEADFTLLRVARPWSLDTYVKGVWAATDARHTHRAGLERHLEHQTAALARGGAHAPEVYASLRLRRRAADRTGRLTIPGVDRLVRTLGLSDARGLRQRDLEELLREEQNMANRLLDYVDSAPAATYELQWLIQRAFTRAVADPVVDEHFQPQALIIEEGDDDVRFQPLQTDVMRLLDAPITVEPRGLRIDGEGGASHQAFLCLGAVPEVVSFPGSGAELLFAPLDALDFPVDAAFSARFVDNADAVRLVRRRLKDADNIFDEERHGYHGPSVSAAERPHAVRELQQYLDGGDRPPLLRASVSLAVAAPSADELEERVARVRREYGAVKLHRPLGDQVKLFVGHLPGQGQRLAHYDDYFTVEQFGAMVPTATHAVGAEIGPYVGHTLSGGRQPVLFDPTEASQTSRAPATLLSGTLGSGKTLCMQLIMYQAFLAGSTICDIDPKGDHALDRLPGVAENMEVIELSPEPRYRGMLDPLRVAPAETREDLACNFLLSILPEPVPPAWQTEIRMAVQIVAARESGGCGDVIAELERGSEDARDAGRALGIHATSGLASLGFSRAGDASLETGHMQVTSLRIRNLTLPLPGTPRAELMDDERIGRAILHLLAVYALRLTSADRRRHSILGFDEAWVLLSDSSGRALVDRISRLGRAQNVTPLLATQVLGDVAELEGLIGAAFCFGVDSEREATEALRLLRLDDGDDALVQRLLSFRRGRCFMRDYEGRVGPVQIDLVDNALLEALDTTPDAGD
jgi:hypothetical protein